jgi:hypothetical protein
MFVTGWCPVATLVPGGKIVGTNVKNTMGKMLVSLVVKANGRGLVPVGKRLSSLLSNWD